MSDEWKKWKVFYRLKTHNVITDWQEAHLTYDNGVYPPPTAEISARHGLLQGIHWRGAELNRFFDGILSSVTEIYELKFVLDEKKPDSETNAPLNVECSKCGHKYCDHDNKY